MKILVVDDDAVCRTMLAQMLKPYGEAEHADNGMAALHAVNVAYEREDPYHLICLDIMMPGLDGQRTLRGIRLLEHARGIDGLDGCRVIMTTALKDKQNILEAFNSQCEAYLIKPIDKTSLYNEIDSLATTSEGGPHEHSSG